MAFIAMALFARRQLPKANSMVSTAGSQRPSIRRECHGGDSPLVSEQVHTVLARRGIPQAHHLVSATGSQERAVGRKSKGRSAKTIAVLVRHPFTDLLSAGRVPETNIVSSIQACGCEDFTAWRPGQALHTTPIRRENAAQLLFGFHIPEDNVLVPVASGR